MLAALYGQRCRILTVPRTTKHATSQGSSKSGGEHARGGQQRSPKTQSSHTKERPKNPATPRRAR